ncbi:unnamed protein product [Lampetra fluviatilis]
MCATVSLLNRVCPVPQELTIGALALRSLNQPSALQLVLTVTRVVTARMKFNSFDDEGFVNFHRGIIGAAVVLERLGTRRHRELS